MKSLSWLVNFVLKSVLIAAVSLGIACTTSWFAYHELYYPLIEYMTLMLSAILIFIGFVLHPLLSMLVMKDVHIRWIREFWQPHLIWLWVLFALTFLSSGVALAFPLVFRYVIDFLETSLAAANPDAAASVTWRAIWIFAVIGFARSVTHLYPGFRAMVNAKIGMDVREHYFSLILRKGYRFFQKFRTGDMVTRLTDDIENFPKIAWFCCSGLFRALESGSKFLFCMGFMLYLNWKLALVSVSPIPIMLTIFYFVRMALTKASLANQQVISKTNDSLESAFSGIRIIKAFRAEENQSGEFRGLLEERIETEVRLRKLWFQMFNLSMWIQQVGQVIVLVVGGAMVVSGELTIGVFYAFYMYLGLLLQPLMDIPHLFVTSRQAFACIDREIEIEETEGGTEHIVFGSLPIKKLNVLELKKVNFRFEDDLPLSLGDINLSLKAGEKAAVVGSVGSGKSTLIKVVAGLIPPVDGDVLLNGRNVYDYSIADYRSRVGYIPQESTLFSESVEENVSFGRDIPEPEIRSALDMAQVLEEMDNLPDGLKQVLGQKGMTVSGGQKQRLAIARALAGNPDLLLMDDCTSALDAENEQRFWEMFADKFPNTACLIVTHRLATARKADVIYVLAEGKIVGAGTHEELLRDCEEYRNFLTREELQAALAG